MAILYPKFFLSSIRCLPCLPLTISLQSFTFLQFAPLSSSSSFPSTPPFNVVSEFLTKECGFSSSQITTIFRRRPSLLRTKSDHAAREAICILKDSGFTEIQLKTTIVRNPVILNLNAIGQLKPKMELLKDLGSAAQDIPIIISRCPRLLSASIENTIAPGILHLETLFGSKEYLRKAIRWTPQILASDFKNQVMPRVEYMKNNLGIVEGSAVFARLLSVLLRLSFEALEEKTKNLANLGLTEENIFLILQRNPRVLQSSTKKIKENVDFLIHTAALMPKVVASHPMILNSSVEKTLKPRYEVFKQLRTNPNSKRLPSLIYLFGLRKKTYLKRFGQYNPQVKSTDDAIS